jgi:hypothetical protein
MPKESFWDSFLQRKQERERSSLAPSLIKHSPFAVTVSG